MKLKFANALSLALILAMLFTSVGLADNVQNDVVAGGNDTITSGGSTVIKYRITANNGDGQTGCNAADSTPATIIINTPAGVTVDTSGNPGNQVTLTFTSCGTDQSATFTSGTLGNHSITVSVSDSGAGTYNTNPAAFTLKVTAPPVQNQTINVAQAAPANAVYGSSFNVTATGGGSGNPVVITSSGACTGGGSGSASITMTSGTGACSVFYNQAAGPGYNAAPQVTSSTTAQKANSTINVTGYSGIYDGAAHGASGTAIGVFGEDLGSSLNLGASFTDVPGGTANWTFTGDNNYNNASGNAPIAISQADATASAGGGSATYDGNTHSPSACVVSGSYTGDLSCANNPTTVGPAAGTYTISPVVSGTQQSNFNVQLVDGSFTINKANPTITWVNPADIVYGTALGATQLNATSSVPGSFVYTPAGGTVLNAGAGQTLHVEFTPDDTTNYNSASKDVVINVTKADAICAINGYTGVYDGAAHGATGSCKGIDGGNLAGLDLGTSFTDVPGGTVNWTFTDQTGNYKDASGTAEIVISKADATIVVNGYTGVYDGAEHSATGLATGVLDEPLAGLDLGASFTNVPGGTANWTFTDETGNYNNASGSVAIDISKADATIIVNSYTGVYDGSAHGATGSVTGVLGESLSGLNLGATFTNVPGGTANWTFTDATGNYKDASGTAAIVISKANATCTVTGYTGIYDGAFHAASGSCSGIGGESAGSLDLGATFKMPPGGIAHWTFTGNSNYNDQSGNVAIVINPWTFGGFFQPVDNGGVLNTVKNGSTVPLKFEVFAGSTELTDIAAVKSITFAQIQCIGTTEDAIETLATSTSSAQLRYDTSASQFIFNWKTPSGSSVVGKCFRVTVETQDGSKLSALFKLK